MTDLQLDATDQAIVRCLSSDARATYSEISKEIGVSVGTVRNRLTHLRESGALFLNVWLDPNRAGLGINATFLLRVEAGKVSDVAEALIPMEVTGYIAVVAGDHDLIVDVFCRDVPHLNRVLQDEVQAIDGVLSVTSYLVTEIKYESSLNIGGLLDNSTET
ncbi:MAG: Lrp/AsnC family transcriptional regulator [Acidimicrobiales bacterium]